MANQKLATVTNELIESYGNTAKNVINAYRVGNERAVVFMDQAFVSAIGKTGTRLSKQARSNAVAAEKKLTAYYSKTVEVTSDNADLVIDKAVKLAGKSVVQVSANAGRFEKSIGVTTLTTLATAAVPAAKAVTKVAVKIEAKSGDLVTKLAGKPAKAKSKAKAKTVTAKKITVKAAPIAVKKAPRVRKTVAKTTVKTAAVAA